MITFPCPGCGQVLKVKEEAAGKAGKCPRCGAACQVPTVTVAAPSPSAAAPPEATQLNPSPGADSATQAYEGSKPAAPRGRGTDTYANDDTAGLRGLQGPSLDFLAPAEAPDELGRLGPYRVLKVLGKGGMGVVFHAEDMALRRTVALKAMLPAAAADTLSARERFLLEARAAAAIEHDHIVTIYQVGEDRGVPFLAMQFLKGESLEQRLQRDRQLPLTEALRIARETALGLAAAHAHGLIHRDIKPANIWLEELPPERGTSLLRYRVKLFDFGLAREVVEHTHLTQTGMILGTPAYMAPEQAAGEPIDGRADLFSLGCVLYRMISGVLPFKGSSIISVLRAVALTEPPPLRDLDPKVPAAVSDLVFRLLAKNPADRPASAQALVELIRKVERELTARPAKSAPATPSPPPLEVPVEPAVQVVATAETLPGELIATPPAPLPQPARISTATATDSLSERRKRRKPPVPSQGGSNLLLWLVLGGVGLLAVVALGVVGFFLLHPSKPGPPLAARTHLVPQPRVRPPLINPPLKVVPVNPPLAVGGEQEALRVLRGHTAPVWAVAYSPDSRRAASGGKDNVILLWDVATGDILRRIPSRQGAVTSVAFGPDGKWLLSGGSDGTLRQWDAESGASLWTFRGPSAASAASL